MGQPQENQTATLASGITREVLENDGLRIVMRQRHPEVALTDDDTMRRSIADTRAARPPAADDVAGVWIFGYGSLLWNPCVSVTEWRIARTHGHHRDFRIRLDYGRGTPENPGLMLGLAPGGSCVGMGLRIDVGDLDHELLMIWRREMLTGVYRPCWVWLYGDMGRVPAITFVMNKQHRCYCNRLGLERQIHLLATGRGMLGSSAEYLANTVARLDAAGIHDRHLQRLQDQVAKRTAHIRG